MQLLQQQLHLHSTMFIFISSCGNKQVITQNIYIPLCLYLYKTREVIEMGYKAIYIPLCLYLYG